MPLLAQAANDLLDAGDRHRVDAREGLVQQDDLGIGDQAAGDFQPPPFAAGERQGQRFAQPGDVELLEQFVAAARRASCGRCPSISITPSRFFSTVSLRKTLDSWAR